MDMVEAKIQILLPHLIWTVYSFIVIKVAVKQVLANASFLFPIYKKETEMGH